MTGLTPTPSDVYTPSDNKADEEEKVGEPVSHHDRCFILRIYICDLMDLFRFFISFLGILVVCDFALVFALAPISPMFCHFFALALALYFTLS